MELGICVSERVLCQLWHGQRWRHHALQTRSGRRVQIVYRGRWSGGHGPDFTDALLTFDHGSLQRGDVEIHLRASDWDAHGHARDHGYDRTILQVVLVDDRTRPCSRADGTAIDVLAVGHLVPGLLTGRDEPEGVGDLDRPTIERCTLNARVAAEPLWRHLGELGDERLQERAARLEADLEVDTPDELVYRGVMEALGYQHNREPMRALASRVPYHLAEAVALPRTGIDRIEALEALLLGAGGFLEGERAPGSPGSRWQHWRTHFGLAPLGPGCWSAARVRPANQPERRLRGLARWLARVAPEGPAAATLRAVQGGSTALGRLGWVPGEGADTPALVGAGRAAEIAVNVALPFALAWAGHTGDATLAAAAHAAYRTMPRLPENRITRLVRAQVFGEGPGRHRHGAREQQGMLHLHRTRCLQMQCLDCPLGGGLVRMTEREQSCPGR